MQHSGSPTPDEIGRALGRKRWRLAFEPALERRFEADTSDARCRTVIRHNHIGLAIYNSFLLGDWLLVRDIFTFSVVLHLLIMSPIMVLVNLAIGRRPAAWMRESLLAGGIVLGTMGILLLTLVSRSPLRSSEHLSIVLVILFATMVQRIRFQYVATARVVSLMLSVLALAGFAAHEPARVMVADAVFAGVVLFSLVGCFNLESELRAGYLLSLRDRLRHEALDRISRRDTLTGVGNRRALEAALERLQSPSARPATLAALLVDIDFFKSFNDVHGHLAGDACLKTVAELIGTDARIRPEQVFRFGGEEFLVLLEGVPLHEAEAIGEEIRITVEAAAIPRGLPGNEVVTVSVGVAAGRLDDGSCEITDLVADADFALYAAKRSGRNRVSLYGVDTREPALLRKRRAA